MEVEGGECDLHIGDFLGFKVPYSQTRKAPV